MKKYFILMSLVLAAVSFAKEELPTVDYVDLNQYGGKWYAVTALPQRFTKNCLYQTAEYGLIDSETVSVLNTCYQGKKRRGPRRTLRDVKTTIRGVAKADDISNSDLTVTFRVLFGWIKFSGDYKVLALDNDYKYALVGAEDRKSLWILSRDKSVPADVKANYIKLANELGFDTSKLVDSKFY